MQGCIRNKYTNSAKEPVYNVANPVQYKEHIIAK